MSQDTARPPAENTRVVVLDDPYGRYIGDTGTVVPEPEFAKGKSYLTGTVWVYMDFQRATDATSGYAKSEPVGFSPDELAPAVEVGSLAIEDDTDHIERLAKLAGE